MLTTGECASLLAPTANSTERILERLRNLIRINAVQPRYHLGRRDWSADDIATAARILGLDGPEVREKIDRIRHAETLMQSPVLTRSRSR